MKPVNQDMRERKNNARLLLKEFFSNSDGQPEFTETQFKMFLQSYLCQHQELVSNLESYLLHAESFITHGFQKSCPDTVSNLCEFSLDAHLADITKYKRSLKDVRQRLREYLASCKELTQWKQVALNTRCNTKDCTLWYSDQCSQCLQLNKKYPEFLSFPDRLH